MTSRPLAMLALLGATACNSSSAPEPCEGQLSVFVSTGPAPTIGWSPACGISELVVSSASTQPGVGGQILWAFNVPESSPIAPRIRYGLNPRGANVWRGPEPLVPGNSYKVSVAYTVGGDGLVARGEATFSR